MIRKRMQSFNIVYVLIVISIFYALFFIKNKKVFPNSNIILISVDHLQVKHLKKYGYSLNTTPNLDRLFNKSYIFENAIAPSSWTLPSAISIFTSTYPERNKMVRVLEDYTKEGTPEEKAKKLADNIKTLTEVLKENKYSTAAFASRNFGLRAESGINRGFDVYFETDANREKISLQPAVKESIKWLRQNKDNNFFLYLQGFDLHDKIDPIQGYDYRYVNKQYRSMYTGSKIEYEKLRFSPVPIDISQEDVDFWRALYDEKINNIDVFLGEFLNSLQELKLLNKSLIIFTSAHGIEHYEHGKFNHGHSLYQELIHVPLIIHLPGQTNERRIESLVSTIDIMPTILSLANVKHSILSQMQGINLLQAMFYGKNISRNVFSETHTFRPIDRWLDDKWSVISPNGYKFIYNLISQENGRVVKKELYNLKTDPSELIDIKNQEKQVSYELEQKLYLYSEKNLLSEFQSDSKTNKKL